MVTHLKEIGEYFSYVIEGVPTVFVTSSTTTNHLTSEKGGTKFQKC